MIGIMRGLSWLRSEGGLIRVSDVQLKRWLFCSAVLMAAICLSACHPSIQDDLVVEPEPSVDIQSALPSVDLESPTPEPPPSLTSTATVEPAIQYQIAEFFPSENYYLSFVSQEGKEQQSFCEYRRIRNGEDIQQRRIRPKDDLPYVQTISFDGAAIRDAYRRKNVGFTYDFTGWVKRGEGDVLLRDPIRLGEAWDVEGGTSSITAVGKLATLPVGELRVVQVTTQFDSGVRREMLFCPGIGMVADFEYQADGELISSVELAEYEENRDYRQTISFYYADRNDPERTRILYDLREVPIKTNQSMETTFRGYLQSKPQGSSLVALGQDVDINKITIRDKSLWVDFSVQMADMVTQAEMDPLLERTFLQALVNTFGGYFQAQNVYLQIEGEPYYSKSIVATADDVWHPELSTTERYPTS